ncbi:MAG: signal peptidase II [Blastocatellia bacterium]|nr:signal peptidase II [Blastocatellia bacterium]
MRRFLLYLPLTFFVLALDQATKLWAYVQIRHKPDISVIDGFLKFSYAENPGIAFGIFSSYMGNAKTIGLLAISFIAIGFVCYLLSKTPSEKRLVITALMLVLGGIIGNLLDRIRFGVVIDFIEFYVGTFHWPNFNIADAAICIGAALLSIDILKEPSKHPKPTEHSLEQNETKDI